MFDLSRALRQQIYLRALATNPKIEIHKGKFRTDPDLYVVLSNDSDLVEPLRILKNDLGKTAGIIFPTDRPSKELIGTKVDIIRMVREGVLASSQYAEILQDKKGKVTKPSTW